MFGRKKKTTVILHVVDRDRPGNTGVVEVLRGQTPRQLDRLEVISAAPRGCPVLLKVFINGRNGAATLEAREGTFRAGQILRVEETKEEALD